MPRRSSWFLLPVLFALLALAGCNLPRDPHATLKKVTGGELIVGHIAGAPVLEAEEEALERIVRALAAEPRIVEGNIHEFAAALENGDIDLFYGALPETTPFEKRIGMTTPVAETEIGGERKKTVFALRKGENAFLMVLDRAIRQEAR